MIRSRTCTLACACLLTMINAFSVGFAQNAGQSAVVRAGLAKSEPLALAESVNAVLKVSNAPEASANGSPEASAKVSGTIGHARLASANGSPEASAKGSLETSLPSDEEKPIDNAEFYGVKTQAKITRRFEIYDPHSAAELKEIRELGFDQVILDRANLHVDATALGLDVVMANWWTRDTADEVIEQSLRLAGEVAPRRLIAISVMDEPERNSPDTPFQYYVDLYKRLKPRMVDRLSGVRLEISYWGPLRKWDQRYYDYFSFLYEAADAMRIMPYPDLHEDPLGEVYLMLQRSKRAMKIADVELPHVVILQTWVLPPENKLPSIDELRVMAYQAMLGGAETLSFFEYQPDTWRRSPGFVDGFRKLMLELRSFSDRLADATIESRLLPNGILDARATWSSGTVARIRVNTNRHEQDGLPELTIQDDSLYKLEQVALDASAQVPIGQSDRKCITIPFGAISCPVPSTAFSMPIELFRADIVPGRACVYVCNRQTCVDSAGQRPCIRPNGRLQPQFPRLRAVLSHQGR